MSTGDDTARRIAAHFMEAAAAGRRLSNKAAARRSEFTPPPHIARISARLKGAAGVGGARILNTADLFTDGLCESCQRPLGRRTAVPMRIQFHDSLSAQIDGGLAQHWTEKGPIFTLLYFSERFVAQLSVAERASFNWRKVQPMRKGRRAAYKRSFLELVASRSHVPRAALRGGSIEPASCSACGWRDQARYFLVGELPAWLDPENDGMRRDQPDWYLNATRVPQPAKGSFTVGDWRDMVVVAFPKERWEELKKQRGTSGVSAIDIGVMDPELTEG